MQIGPFILDRAGNPMDQDRNGIPGEDGDFYSAHFGIEGPRILSHSPAGTVGAPVLAVRVIFNKPMAVQEWLVHTGIQ